MIEGNIIESYENEMDVVINEDNEWLRQLQSGMVQRPKPAVPAKPKPKFVIKSNKQRRGIRNG
jgi:hypothetical protein